MIESPENKALKVDHASLQAREYFRAAQAIVKLFQLILTTVIRLDFVSYSAKRAIERDDRAAETGEMPKDEPNEIADPVQLMKENPGPLTRAYWGSRQLLLQMLFEGGVSQLVEKP